MKSVMWGYKNYGYARSKRYLGDDTREEGQAHQQAWARRRNGGGADAASAPPDC